MINVPARTHTDSSVCLRKDATVVEACASEVCVEISERYLESWSLHTHTHRAIWGVYVGVTFRVTHW